VRFLSVFLAAVLLFAACVHPASAARQDFKTWLQGVRAEARQKGISDKTIHAALPDSLESIPRIIELDRKQPEGTTTFDDYLKRIVNRDRIEKGKARMREYPTLLGKVSKAYGVEPEVIVALWGVETNYGTITGGFDVVNALATLAHDGRRSDYFRGELMHALQIIDEGHIRHDDMKGSWAGAMGQTQFMPSSFFRFAEDFNADGRRDIWRTQADVFASAANYLAKSGWKKGQPWGRKVVIPHSIDRKTLGVDNRYSLQFWHDQGVRMPNGKPVPFEGAYQASVIQPSGPGTSAYIVYDNYQVILKWNRSSYFATSVGLLSDALAGAVTEKNRL